MKHSLLFLTVYLMSSTQYSFCQTNKLDELAVKGASLVSSKLPAAVNNMQAEDPAKPHGVTIKTDMGTNAVAKQYNGSKAPSVSSHTQQLQHSTETLETNTDALIANTRALQANTEAMQANIRAAQANAAYRMRQRQQADVNAALPTKTVPVYSPAVMVKNNTQTAAPAPQPARVAVRPMTLAATPPKPVAKPLPAPGTLLKEVKPQPAVAKAPVKPASTTAPVSVMPVMLAKAPRPAPTMPVAAKAVRPVVAASEVRTISSLPIAAAAAKPSVKAPVARVENGRLVSTMPMPEPMHKAQVSTQPTTLPAQARIANPSIKAMQRTPGSISLNYLMRMPMLDASYEVANGATKPVAVASRSGLKEGDMITTQGYLRVIATQDSGKADETYVLQIAAHINGVDSCFLVKIPSNQSGPMTTKETADNAKRFIKENLAKGMTPCSRGNTVHNAVYVSVTGKLAYNTTRAKVMRNMKDGNRVKRNMNAYTPWEIHSIRNIEFSLP